MLLTGASVVLGVAGYLFYGRTPLAARRGHLPRVRALGEAWWTGAWTAS